MSSSKNVIMCYGMRLYIFWGISTLVRIVQFDFQNLGVYYVSWSSHSAWSHQWWFLFLTKGNSEKIWFKTFLEIDSSSGQCSTQALVEGILCRVVQDANLFCMELSSIRFMSLVKTYEHHPFLFPYNLSSVKVSDFPSKEEVTHFYNSTKTGLNKFELNLVLSWLQQDIDHINFRKLNFCGIEFIKYCN